MRCDRNSLLWPTAGTRLAWLVLPFECRTWLVLPFWMPRGWAPVARNILPGSGLHDHSDFSGFKSRRRSRVATPSVGRRRLVVVLFCTQGAHHTYFRMSFPFAAGDWLVFRRISSVCCTVCGRFWFCCGIEVACLQQSYGTLNRHYLSPLFVLPRSGLVLLRDPSESTFQIVEW